MLIFAIRTEQKTSRTVFSSTLELRLTRLGERARGSWTFQAFLRRSQRLLVIEIICPRTWSIMLRLMYGLQLSHHGKKQHACCETSGRSPANPRSHEFTIDNKITTVNRGIFTIVIVSSNKIVGYLTGQPSERQLLPPNATLLCHPLFYKCRGNQSSSTV